VGAVLSVELADGATIRRTLYAGGDTYSQSERVFEVGLGGAMSFSRATVHWPSGREQRVDDLLVLDQVVTITEPAD
jgi:hypothetical protein